MVLNLRLDDVFPWCVLHRGFGWGTIFHVLCGIKDVITPSTTLSAFFNTNARTQTPSRIHMDWIDSLALRMFIKYTANSPEHMVHWLTKVFSSMSCNEDELTISNPIKFRMSIILSHSVLHSINDCVSGDIDFRRVFSLFNQIIYPYITLRFDR